MTRAQAEALLVVIHHAMCVAARTLTLKDLQAAQDAFMATVPEDPTCFFCGKHASNPHCKGPARP